MQTILTIVQVFLSIALIALVLIQHGRGADAGAAFGSGASSTVFGARGSGSFLSRATGILAALFFLTSMALAYYAAKGSKPAGLMDAADGMQVKLQVPAKETPAPVTQAQGSADVPVVPGVVTQSVTSDVPAVPGVTPVPAESKPASPQVDAAPAPKPVQIEAPAAETIKVEVAQPVAPAPQQEEKAPTSATELPSQGSAMAPKQESIVIPAAEPVKVEMPQLPVPTSQQEVEKVPAAEVPSQGSAPKQEPIEVPAAEPAKVEVTQPTVPTPKKEETAPTAAVPPQGSGAADVPKPESFSVDQPK